MGWSMFCSFAVMENAGPEHGVAVTERHLSGPDWVWKTSYQAVPSDAALFGKLPLQCESEFCGERPCVVHVGVKNIRTC